MNSLDGDDLATIENAIAEDPTVKDRLDKLRVDFQGLLEANQDDLPEPPGDLADSTMRAISDGAKRLELGAPTRWAQFCRRFGGVFTPANAPAGQAGMFTNVLELSVLAVCVLVFGFILISNTFIAREQARRQSCGYQMSKLGFAFQDYAYHSRDQVGPEIELAGPLSFAGVYAVRLHDSNLLCIDDSLWCPGSEQSDSLIPITSIRALPSVEQLMRAKAQELQIWKRWIGGSYAYNLGVMYNGRYFMPRYLSRSHFAILGDAPVLVKGTLSWNNHGANVSNILYEDGRVDSRVCGSKVESIDHPYLNERGELHAGVDDEDAALGPSQMGPFDSIETLETLLARP